MRIVGIDIENSTFELWTSFVQGSFGDVDVMDDLLAIVSKNKRTDEEIEKIVIQVRKLDDTRDGKPSEGILMVLEFVVVSLSYFRELRSVSGMR